MTRAVLCGLLFCSGLVMAADDDDVDADFIEYLGMWEESDEDWLMLEKASVDEENDSDTERRREDPPEKDDES